MRSAAFGPHRRSMATKKGDNRSRLENKPAGTRSHQPASDCIRVSEGIRTPDIQSHSLTTPLLKFPSDNNLQANDPAACRPACRIGPADGDLARVVAAWAELPEAVRAAVLLLVDSAAKRP
jgi:hypothetical protein